MIHNLKASTVASIKQAGADIHVSLVVSIN